MKLEPKSSVRHLMLGQAGVHRVASELILRGHVPLFPDTDYGFDMELDNHLRIQIKTARLQKHRQFPSGVYRFSFRRDIVGGSRGPSGRLRYRRYLGSEPRNYAAVADFFILWGVNEDRFWIVPCSEKPRDLFIIGKDDVKHTPWLDFEQIKQMRDAGMNNCQIAREFNVSHTTIRLAFVRGDSKSNAKNGVRFAMTCESRWDLLDVNAAVEKTLVEAPVLQV